MLTVVHLHINIDIYTEIGGALKRYKQSVSLGSSLIIFSSFLFFRSLVKNDSLGNFDFNRQRHLDFSSNFVG